MIVYAFVEGILKFFIFSRFFHVFCQKIFKNTAYPSYDEDAYTKICVIFEEFPTKIHEKSRNYENFQNSFDKSIDNHMNVPDTKNQLIWSQGKSLIREKCGHAINLVWSKIDLKQPSGDIFW